MKHLAEIQVEFYKNAIDFTSQEAYDKYKKEHPKANMRHHKIVKSDRIGDEKSDMDRTGIFTHDKGWIYFDHDDEGRKELEEERERIKSFLDSQRD